jgi:DNA-binding transcriptional regulator YhcF (GntR family)
VKQYEKVVRYVEEAVANAQLKVGDKLPSIRTLAKTLSLSHASVIKGYQHLEAEHWIYIIPKKRILPIGAVTGGH